MLVEVAAVSSSDLIESVSSTNPARAAQTTDTGAAYAVSEQYRRKSFSRKSGTCSRNRDTKQL
jgi:hypothetical protein